MPNPRNFGSICPKCNQDCMLGDRCKCGKIWVCENIFSENTFLEGVKIDDPSGTQLLTERARRGNTGEVREMSEEEYTQEDESVSTVEAKPALEDVYIAEALGDHSIFMVNLKLNFIDANLIVRDGKVQNGPTKLKWMWTKTNDDGEIIKARLADVIDWYERTDKVKEDGTVYGGELISCSVVSVRQA